MTHTMKSKSKAGNSYFSCMELLKEVPDGPDYCGHEDLTVTGLAIQKVLAAKSLETSERSGTFYAEGLPSFGYFKDQGE